MINIPHHRIHSSLVSANVTVARTGSSVTQIPSLHVNTHNNATAMHSTAVDKNGFAFDGEKRWVNIAEANPFPSFCD